MQTIELKSWENYCAEINKLQHKYDNIPILFRGQADSIWPLTTTLERFSKNRWTIKNYCELVINCVAQIESLKQHTSIFPEISDIRQELLENFDQVLVHIPNAISFYWTYLRHYGFPSPLLDWSTSPYIAGFFAFSENTKAKKVAIFAFIDSINEKHIWLGRPQITSKWLNIHSNERHNRQKSCYTVATKAIKKDHEFVRYDKVVNENEINQDILIKFIIPSYESMKALKFLDQHNINYYSLIGNHEALLKTLAFREIRLRNL
jgi:hypothetical protein